MVFSTVPSASSSQVKVGKAKVSKNPGLSLSIARSQLEQVKDVRVLTDIAETDDGAQYIFIHSDSPFYKGVLPPRTPAYLSFTGFAFACDALSGEGSLTKTPHELLDEELQNRMPSSQRRSPKNTRMPKSPGLLLNLTRDLTCPSPRVIVRRQPSTANSFTSTPGLEPSSDVDSDSDIESDEDAQFVYIPANSPYNTAASTARTASAYLSLSAIPFACDALAEEDPLFVTSPSGPFDEDSTVSLTTEGGVVVVDLENAAGELLITREWAQDTHTKSLSKGLQGGPNAEARVLQQYL